MYLVGGFFRVVSISIIYFVSLVWVSLSCEYFPLIVSSSRAKNLLRGAKFITNIYILHILVLKTHKKNIYYIMLVNFFLVKMLLIFLIY